MTLKPPGGANTPINSGIAEEGTALAWRPQVNFVGDAVTATDDSANSRTKITVSAPTVFNVKNAEYGAIGDNSTDDTAAIQAAIDAAENAIHASNNRGGAEVYLPAGAYKLTAPLKIRLGALTFRGVGRGFTTGGVIGSSNPINGGSILRPASTFTGSWVIQVGEDVVSPVKSLGGVTLRDFAIEGFSLGTTVAGGIHFQAQRSEIRDVLVCRMTGDGIYVEAPDHVTTYPKGAYDNHIRDVIITQGSNTPSLTGHGLWFSDGASDNVIEGLIVRGTQTGGGKYGIYIQGPGNQFQSGLVELCNDWAVYCAESRNSKFIGMRIMDCAGGIYLASSDVNKGGDWNVTGCTFRSCSRLGDNLTDGIQVNPAVAMRGGVISGCDFSSVGRNDPGYAMRYLINIASANAIGVTVGPYTHGYATPSTRSYGTAPVNDVGTGTRIGPYVIGRSAVGVSHTGDLVETALVNVTVPARAMGPNGRVRVTSLWSRNAGGTANATAKVRFGGGAGTTYTNVALTTANLSGKFQGDISNRNATNSQIGAAASSSFGIAAGAVITGAIDTTADVVIAFTGTLADVGDTITLESYTVELLP